MAITTGRVDCIQVLEDSCFFQILEDGTGETEAFIMWFGTSDLSASTRITHSMWLSIVREALATGRQIVIAHPDDGAQVTSIRANSTA